MYRTYPRIIRIISCILTAAFFCQDITWAYGGEPISIPYNLGTVKTAPASLSPAGGRQARSLTEGGTDPLRSSPAAIINIQDAHASLAAQRSIVSIIDRLVSDYDIRIIALEGSSGYIDTSILRASPDKRLREEASRALMEEGRMSAGEFFAVTSDKSITLYGVEDEALYSENVRQFGSVYKDGARMAGEASALLKSLEPLKEKLYSAELKELEKNRALYESGRIGFTEFWAGLDTLCAAHGIDRACFSNISKLILSLDLERGIDFARADRERESLVESLSRSARPEDIKELIIKSLEFKNGRISQGSYYSYIMALASGAGIDIPAHKALAGYAEYITLYESIDIVGLFEEAREAEDIVRDRLLRTPEERQLSDFAELAERARELFEMKTGRREIEKLEKLLRAPRLADSEIFEAIPAAIEFYKTAARRDEAMIENTIKRMAQEGRTAAALVTGGYHSEGLSNLASQKGVEYFIILPKFDASGPGRPYAAILTKNRKPYDALIAGGEHYLAVGAYCEGVWRSGSAEEAAGAQARLFAYFRAYAGNLLENTAAPEKPALINEAIDRWVLNYRRIFRDEEGRAGFKPMSPEALKKLLETLARDEMGIEAAPAWANASLDGLSREDSVAAIEGLRKLCEESVSELAALKKRLRALLEPRKVRVKPGFFADAGGWFGILAAANIVMRISDLISGRRDPKRIREAAVLDILNTLDKVKNNLDVSGPAGEALADIPMLEMTGSAGERFLGSIVTENPRSLTVKAISEARGLLDGSNGTIRAALPLYNNQIEVNNRELLFQKLERVLWGQIQVLRDVGASLAIGEYDSPSGALEIELERRRARFDTMVASYEKIVRPIDYGSFTVFALWQKILFMWTPPAVAAAVTALAFSGVNIIPVLRIFAMSYCVLSLTILIHKIFVIYKGLMARNKDKAAEEELTPIIDIQSEELKMLPADAMRRITKDGLTGRIPEGIRVRLGPTEDISKDDLPDKVLEALTPAEVLGRLSLKTRSRLEESGADLGSKSVILGLLDKEEYAVLRAYDALPLVTIFLPVYKEANVIELLMGNVKRLEYPKLEIIVIGEEDDAITMPILYEWRARGQIPAFIKIVAGHVPGPNLPLKPHQPRTKPRAIQYALEEATGEYMIIYDAEDRPEENQINKFVHSYVLMDIALDELRARIVSGGKFDIDSIKKAALMSEDARLYEKAARFGFDTDMRKMARRLGLKDSDLVDPAARQKLLERFEKVNRPAALSGFLDWFNWYKSMTTHFFSAEYQTHFKLYIPGLSATRSAVLLPGTTYFMPLDTYRKLGGLDIYNVTEDEHMGVLLWLRGYRTVVLNVTTLEEAIDDLLRGKWIRQRSRWFKGDWHSFFVYLRHPGEIIANRGLKGFFEFFMVIGGSGISSYLYFLSTIVTYLWGLSFLPMLPIVGGRILAIPVLGEGLRLLSATMRNCVPQIFDWMPINPALGGFLLFAFPQISMTLLSQIAAIIPGPNDKFKLHVTVDEIRKTADGLSTRAASADPDKKTEFEKEVRRLREQASRIEEGRLTPHETAFIAAMTAFFCFALPPIGLAYCLMGAYIYGQYHAKGRKRPVIAMGLKIASVAYLITGYFINVMIAGYQATVELVTGRAHLWQLTTHYGRKWEVGMKKVAGIKPADLWENTKLGLRVSFLYLGPLFIMMTTALFDVIGKKAYVSPIFIRGLTAIVGITAAAYFITLLTAYISDRKRHAPAPVDRFTVGIPDGVSSDLYLRVDKMLTGMRDLVELKKFRGAPEFKNSVKAGLYLDLPDKELAESILSGDIFRYLRSVMESSSAPDDGRVLAILAGPCSKNELEGALAYVSSRLRKAGPFSVDELVSLRGMLEKSVGSRKRAIESIHNGEPMPAVMPDVRSAAVTSEGVLVYDMFGSENMENSPKNVVNCILYGKIFKAESELRSYLRSAGYGDSLIESIKFINTEDGGNSLSYQELIASIMTEAGVERSDIGIRAARGDRLIREGDRPAAEKFMEVRTLEFNGFEVVAAANSYQILLRMMTRLPKDIPEGAFALDNFGIPGVIYNGRGIFRYLPAMIPLDYHRELLVYRQAMEVLSVGA